MPRTKIGKHSGWLSTHVESQPKEFAMGSRKYENTINVLEAMVEYKKENNGAPPTIRDLCDANGVSSTSTIASHLHHLEEWGLVTKVQDQRRWDLTPGTGCWVPYWGVIEKVLYKHTGWKRSDKWVKENFQSKL